MPVGTLSVALDIRARNLPSAGQGRKNDTQCQFTPHLSHLTDYPHARALVNNRMNASTDVRVTSSRESLLANTDINIDFGVFATSANALVHAAAEELLLRATNFNQNNLSSIPALSKLISVLMLETTPSSDPNLFASDSTGEKETLLKLASDSITTRSLRNVSANHLSFGFDFVPVIGRLLSPIVDTFNGKHFVGLEGLIDEIVRGKLLGFAVKLPASCGSNSMFVVHSIADAFLQLVKNELFGVLSTSVRAQLKAVIVQVRQHVLSKLTASNGSSPGRRGGVPSTAGHLAPPMTLAELLALCPALDAQRLAWEWEALSKSREPRGTPRCQIFVDFSMLFGPQLGEENLSNDVDCASPSPKLQQVDGQESSPLPVVAGCVVGSIVHKAFKLSQKAASVHSASLLMEGGGAAVKGGDGGAIRLSATRFCSVEDGAGEASAGERARPPILMSNQKRSRSEEILSEGINEVDGPIMGSAYTSCSFLPPIPGVRRLLPDSLRSLGSSLKDSTLSARRDSMRKLAGVNAFFRNVKHQITQPKSSGAWEARVSSPKRPHPLTTSALLDLSYREHLLSDDLRNSTCSVHSCQQSLPYVSIPIVIGNTSDWLGEKAAATANHRWSVYVRGINNASLSGIIDHVTFVLHPSFPKPQQTLFKEPFVLTEHGWGEFDITLYIKFKHIELPMVTSITSPTAASPTMNSSTSTQQNRGIYVKCTHGLKFSHRNPLLLAAESRVNQDVADAMTQPPAVLFGSSALITTPTIPPGTNLQSIQFLLTNPTLSTALPPLPDTPTAVVHKLHCVPPNGNAYYGPPGYTPFAQIDSTVVAETRDELVLFHPSPSLLAEVGLYLTACASFSPAPVSCSIPPPMFSKLLKHSPLLCYYAGKFNEWPLYQQQALQDKRLLVALEADLVALMQRYVVPVARDEIQSSALHQLKQVGVQ